MTINIPNNDQKRIVVVGAGFAGLSFAQKMAKQNVQIVLIDKNNYHQFQPLFYQVAMAGLEPSAISFPLRKVFQKKKNVFIRVTELAGVNVQKQEIQTTLGPLTYDALIISTGVNSNYFGNEELAQKTIPMKSVSEALYLRNRILTDYEKALVTPEYGERQGLIDIVIVGGGPTGVEVAGALAEMKQYILPKDYTELNNQEVDIYVVQGSECLLKGMSDNSSKGAAKFLEELGVKIKLNTRVVGYDGEYVSMNDGTKIRSKKVIWAAGVKGRKIKGLSDDFYNRSCRLLVDDQCKVIGTNNVFALGDTAAMQSEALPFGHPQLAQVALQQGKFLAKHLESILADECEKSFIYKDLGSMATIGRNRAVVDLPKFKFKGFFAWMVWLFVHLFSILGVKNKVMVFINWIWNYFTYDQSLRLIIKPVDKKEKEERVEA